MKTDERHRRLNHRRVGTNSRLASIMSVWILVTVSFIGFITLESSVVSSGSTIYVGIGPGNDTASIQDAIDNYSYPGDIVYVYSGTYYENVVVNKTINLTGEDKATTVIDGGGSGDVVNITADWVNISGLTISNSGSEVSWPDFDVGIKFYMVQNCWVINNNVTSINGSGIYLYSSSNNSINDNNVSSNNWYSIILSSSSYVNISNNIIHDNGLGITLYSSSFVNVQENEIYNNWGDGIRSQYSSDNTYINNIVHDQINSGGVGGHGFFFSGTPYSNNKIIGNVVYNNGADGIHLEAQSAPDPKAFWNNSIINNTVYNNTLDGILIGIGINNFIIDNVVNNNGLGTINPRGGISLHSSSNSVVRGNIVHNNDNGILIDKSVDSMPPINNTITENMIYNNDNAGVRLGGAIETTFIRNSIIDNTYNVHIERQTISSNFINCTLSNATINVYITGQSIRNNFLNCTLLNGNKDDFNLTDDSHAILLNTTFNKTRTYYGDILSSLTVMWFMHVKVIYYNGTPVSNAQIWVNDTCGANQFNGPTDSNGWTSWIIVLEYIEQDMNGDHNGERIYFTPHWATATDGILLGYAYPDPFMDESKTILIILGDYTLMNLEPGWNLISLPRVQLDTNLQTILQSIEEDYNAVQWYNIVDTNDHWKHYHVSKPSKLNDLGDINHTMGFWIHVTNPNGTTLIVKGNVFASTQNITLYPGWNQVGYPSTTIKTRDIALNNLNFGIEVDAIWAFDGATQTWEDVGSGDEFKLRKGYWVHATQECVWDVPL
jgi:parallel beta-helix repeat protein